MARPGSRTDQWLAVDAGGGLSACLAGAALLAGVGEAEARVADLADLSIEELSRIPVTSVLRRPEPLSSSASAMQIITGEEVRRSGATTLPEALRLAPNLQVKQIRASDWAITARGFSSLKGEAGTLANKLLVLIDGRPIYTPVFGGVFWETHNVLLDDLERIEIVSGPGGSLWGSNAVNGVINIIRRPAAETTGWYGNVTAGALAEDVSLRYGAPLGEQAHFRVYGQALERDALTADGGDQWQIRQAGFRADIDQDSRGRLTLQGDIHSGHQGKQPRLGINGYNLVGTWQYAPDKDSQWRVTSYLDQRWRELENVDLREEVLGLDLQHRRRLSPHTELVWGTNIRSYRDRTASRTGAIRFIPESRRLADVSGFAQAEVALRPNRLMLSFGSKLSHTTYSHLEAEPNARIAWHATPTGTLWGAVSRAVRTPTRVDRDVETEDLIGSRTLAPERLTALEAGYRWQPSPRAAVSVAVYRNHYRSLRTFSRNPDPPPRLAYTNGAAARTWGAELFGMFAVSARWRLRAFYTYDDAHARATRDDVATDPNTAENQDSRQIIGLHSMMDLGRRLQLDVFVRRVGATRQTWIPPEPGVPAHTSVDARLAWQNRHWEVALLGKNLNGAQTEIYPQAIPRYLLLRTRLWYQ